MPRNKDQSEQMRTESLKRILSTAQQLFAERGYDGCSVSDIAKQAGMSQGNIYWYFSSKEEILRQVLIDGFADLGSTLAAAQARSGSGREKLQAFLTGFDDLMRDKEGEEFLTIVMTIIGQGGASRFAEIGLSTRQIGEGYHSSLDTIIAEGQAEGTITGDTDPHLLAAFFFSFINGMMLMYPEEWRSFPKDVVRQAVLRLLGCGGA